MPHRLLHAMPGAWKRRYLLRQSGGIQGCDAFNLAERLKKTQRLLVAWPTRAEDMLLAVPAVKSLREALGEGVVFGHLAEAALGPFLSGLFPGVPLIAWDQGSLAWHEPAVQNCLASLRAFNPDTALGLLDPFPPVLQALVKASGAGVRIAIDPKHVSWPYANVRIASDPSAPLAGRYFQPLGLWRYAGFPAEERWSRIQPDDSQRKAVAENWAASGSAPEQTWLYLHATASGPALDPGLHALLREKIQKREQGNFALGLLHWNSSGEELQREGVWRESPLLTADGLGALLGIMDGARGVVAFQGPALHFASLAEVPCLALLRKEEKAYDVSPWNPLFAVSEV